MTEENKEVPAVVKKFDETTRGEDLLNRLREVNEEDADWLAARDEFARRARNFDINAVLVQELLMHEPFYAYISRRVNRAKTFAVPTAAVTALDDTLVMLWNPAFFTRIAPDWQDRSSQIGKAQRKKVAGVLIHEFLHLILKHVTDRREGVDYPVLWNWATDLAINCMIPRNFLPDGLLIPGEPLTIPEDAEQAYRPEDVEQYQKLSDFIENLPVKLAAEDYYSRLLDHIENESPEMLQDPEWGMPQDGVSPPCTCGDQDGEGDGQDGEGEGSGGQDDQDGDQEGEGQGDGQGHDSNCPQHGDGNGKGQGKKLYGGGRGRLGQFDDHDQWDKVSKQEKDLIRQRVRGILKDAINDADNSKKSNAWGSVPVEMQVALRKLISDQIDWRALLRQFIGYTQHMNRSSTMKRVNRRYPYIHPGTRRGHGATLWLYIDQSGSVGDKDIELLFGELDQLAKKANFRVYFFDTEVDDNHIEWRRGQSHPAMRRRYGGTDFEAATQHANDHAGEYDAFLILTDGECSKPSPARKPRCWVITPDRQLLFETDERVIKMERPKKAINQ